MKVAEITDYDKLVRKVTTIYKSNNNLEKRINLIIDTLTLFIETFIIDYKEGSHHPNNYIALMGSSNIGMVLVIKEEYIQCFSYNKKTKKNK